MLHNLYTLICASLGIQHHYMDKHLFESRPIVFNKPDYLGFLYRGIPYDIYLCSVPQGILYVRFPVW